MSKKVSADKDSSFRLHGFCYAPFSDKPFMLTASINGDEEPGCTKGLQFGVQELFNKLYRCGLIVPFREKVKFSRRAPEVRLLDYSCGENGFWFAFTTTDHDIGLGTEDDLPLDELVSLFLSKRMRLTRKQRNWLNSARKAA